MRDARGRFWLVLCLLGWGACGYGPLPRLSDASPGDASPGDASPGDTPPDGASDSSIDAATCFGTGIVRVCLQAPPAGPLTISTPRTIDTGDPAMCAVLASSNGSYCVLAGTSITINSAVTVRGIGAKPLVLIASDMIVNDGRIDVGSHRGAVLEIGAGADGPCAQGPLPTLLNATSGGGAGGSLAGQGGNGGAGGNSTGTGGAGGVAGIGPPSPIVTLQGGCAGQDGEGGVNKAPRGHGGGAVYLIAGNKIIVNGDINAAGEGGGGGTPGNPTGGGGGGGAGGMIGFDAPTIMGNGLILASGGGGGEGSSPGNAGNNGGDPSAISAARGGNGATAGGGDGGDGSSAAATGPGAAGQTPPNGSAGSGGGGGGGAGLVKAPATATLGTRVSPPPTP